MLSTEISKVRATEILDSRGNPTVLCKVTLACGASGTASVPSGASTGKYEAHEKRDGGARYGGRGVLEVCKKLESELAQQICGKDAAKQKLIDGILLRADGTPKKSVFGANALLSVSLACARASACAYKLPLYRYLGGIYGSRMPIPMMNVINGGAHAGNELDVQEFMIVPVGAESLHDAVRGDLRAPTCAVKKGRARHGSWGRGRLCPGSALRRASNRISVQSYRNGGLQHRQSQASTRCGSKRMGI